jgi:beta-glucosidase
MLMAPDSWRPLYLNTLKQARDGTIPLARIEDAARRIIRAKILAGLYEPDRYSLAGRFDLLAASEHRALARQAVRQSLVLLKNNNQVLPIHGRSRVLVAGSGADNISLQTGGWTLSWQGTGHDNSAFPAAQSIWSGIREAVSASGGQASLRVDGKFEERPDVAILVMGETPYAEFVGDVADLDFAAPASDLAALSHLRAQKIPVVIVFLSGRPMWVNPEINQADGFVAAWLPGSEGGGIADVLIGDGAGKPRYDFRGKLSFSWPEHPDQGPLNRGDATYQPLFAYGYGLTYQDRTQLGLLSDVRNTPRDTKEFALFDKGRVPPPWSFVLSDAMGPMRATLARATSPAGAVNMVPIDAGAQEAGRRITFHANGGSFAISGPPLDIYSLGLANPTLSFRLSAQLAPPAGSRLTIGPQAIDLAAWVTPVGAGSWQQVEIPLACIPGLSPQTGPIDTLFALHVPGAWDVGVADVVVKSGPTHSTCPG